MNDSFRHKGLRKRLIETLKQKGIQDSNVLEAMYAIPRHFFLDNAFEEHAYEDKAFPIDENQTISQPFTVGFQTQLLDIKPKDKILEIGTGSGYQTAVLSKMGAKVFSVERHRSLYLQARKMFNILKLNGILNYHGDGYQGLTSFSPYDKIIVTAGAPYVPKALLQQLKVGGMLVIPMGENAEQTMYRYTKTDEHTFKKESFSNFRFVPLLKGKKN